MYITKDTISLVSYNKFNFVNLLYRFVLKQNNIFTMDMVGNFSIERIVYIFIGYDD